MSCGFFPPSALLPTGPKDATPRGDKSKQRCPTATLGSRGVLQGAGPAPAAPQPCRLPVLPCSRCLQTRPQPRPPSVGARGRGPAAPVRQRAPRRPLPPPAGGRGGGSGEGGGGEARRGCPGQRPAAGLGGRGRRQRREGPGAGVEVADLFGEDGDVLVEGVGGADVPAGHAGLPGRAGRQLALLKDQS